MVTVKPVYIEVVTLFDQDTAAVFRHGGVVDIKPSTDILYRKIMWKFFIPLKTKGFLSAIGTPLAVGWRGSKKTGMGPLGAWFIALFSLFIGLAKTPSC